MSRQAGDAAASLIDDVLRAGVRDRRVIEAFRAVARAHFVPAPLRDLADLDQPIAIGHGQVTTQPSLVARMVEALELSGDDRVLEVGAGLGYETAISVSDFIRPASTSAVGDVPAGARRGPRGSVSPWTVRSLHFEREADCRRAHPMLEIVGHTHAARVGGPSCAAPVPASASLQRRSPWTRHLQTSSCSGPSGRSGRSSGLSSSRRGTTWWPPTSGPFPGNTSGPA